MDPQKYVFGECKFCKETVRWDFVQIVPGSAGVYWHYKCHSCGRARLINPDRIRIQAGD